VSDDTGEGDNATVLQFRGTDPTYIPAPTIPSYEETAPAPVHSEIPPETPEETTMELPRVPGAPNPEDSVPPVRIPSALYSESAESDGDGEYEEYGDGEYEVPRSLADRLGDWLEYRMEMGRARNEAEGPYREADIAQKIARIEAGTDREVGLLGAHNQLRQAGIKAAAARAAARGKADAAVMDKGLSKSGSVGRGGSGRTNGGGYSGSNGSGGGRGGSRNSGSGNASGSGGRGSGVPSGSRGGSGRGNDASGGARGRQNGPRGTDGTRGNGGGSGGGGGGRQTSSSRAERTRGRQERAAARTAGAEQRRSATQAADLADRTKDRDRARDNRQVRREERKARRNNPDRVTLGEALGREAERRFDRRRKAEDDKRTEDEKAKAEAEKAKTSGTDPADPAAATGTGTPDPATAAPGTPGAGGPKVDLTKKPGTGTLDPADPADPATGTTPDPAATSTTAPDPAAASTTTPDPADPAATATSTGTPDPAATPSASTPDPAAAPPDPASGSTTPDPGTGTPDPSTTTPDPSGSTTTGSSPGPADGATTTGSPGGRSAQDDQDDLDAAEDYLADGLWQRLADRLRRSAGGRSGDDPLDDWAWQQMNQRARRESEAGTGERFRRGQRRPEPEETVKVTYDFPDHPAAAPKAAPTAQPEEEIPDADIVEEAAPALPPAPVKHTQRPGTTRPAPEGSVTNQQGRQSRPTYNRQAAPRQHATNVTFEEYLVDVANIATAAGADKEEADSLAAALAVVADQLREMASDLIGDHNIDTAVTDMIADLADQADAMKAQAQRCATECETAFVAAVTVAKSVARVYGEDQAAKDESGLAQASAAAHHD